MSALNVVWCFVGGAVVSYIVLASLRGLTWAWRAWQHRKFLRRSALLRPRS